MRLTVHYDIKYPPSMSHMWKVTDEWRVYTGWNATYPEAVEAGLDALADQMTNAEIRRQYEAVVDTVMQGRIW